MPADISQIDFLMVSPLTIYVYRLAVTVTQKPHSLPAGNCGFPHFPANLLHLRNKYVATSNECRGRCGRLPLRKAGFPLT
jgi:hypothetical protein